MAIINFTFNNPMYLWYLISLPFLVYTHFYLLKHSKQKAMKFANFEALKRVSGDKLLTKNITILILRLVILTCIIFSVADTTMWYEGKVNKNDFVIALDVSASMTAEDIKPTRLDAAKDAATDFVTNLESNSNIGIITFAGTTFIDSEPINNKDTLVKTINAVQISKTGGTDIAGAMITGTNMLLASEKGKTMILITDGSNTVSAFMTDSIKNGIEYAKRNHVVIHTIGIGSDSGPIGYLPEYYNVSAVYNENTLLEIANATQGKYYHVLTADDLEAARKEISSDSDKAMIPIKLSYGLMLVILLLLFVEWGLISTRFRRIP